MKTDEKAYTPYGYRLNKNLPKTPHEARPQTETFQAWVDATKDPDPYLEKIRRELP